MTMHLIGPQSASSLSTRRGTRVPFTAFRQALVLSGFALSVLAAPAATLTWDNDSAAAGPQDGAGNWDSTSPLWWNGAGNVTWTNADGNSAIFGSGGVGGAITVGAGTVVANLTFNTNYVLSGNPLTLTNTAVITTAAGSSNAIGSILAGKAFTKEGAGILTLNPGGSQTYTGLTTVNQGILNVGGNNAYIYVNGDLLINPGAAFLYSHAGSGGPVETNATVIINGGGFTNVGSARNFYINKVILDNNGVAGESVNACYLNPTNIDARSGRILLSRYRTAIALAKSTPGTVLITNRPNTAGSDGHVVTMNAGTLIFDKSGHAANRLKTGSLLTLGGGTLIFTNGNTSVSPNAENPSASGVSVVPGASALAEVNGGTGGGNITLGPIARAAGGTLDVSQSGPGLITTTTANQNGILGGWATYAGQGWLVGSSSVSFTNLLNYESNSAPAAWSATTNVSLAANPSANLDDVTIHSLRLTAAATLTLNPGKTLTLASGGLLVTGSGATAINDGTLLGAAGQDLVILQNATGDLTISSTLADNAAATALTKSGPGKLILTGANTMTGKNYLNGGVVEISRLNQLAAGSLVLNGGTIRYTGADAADSRVLTVNGLGATYDVVSGTTLTLAGVITGSGAVMGDLGGLAKNGAGTLALTASNYFNGPTVVSAGTLLVNGRMACDKTVFLAGRLNVNGGTLGGSGTIDSLVAVQNGATLSPGAGVGTLTLSSNLTLQAGSISLFDLANAPGSGDLVVVRGDLTVNNGIVQVNVAGTALVPGTYPLFQYSGKLTGAFSPAVSVVGGSIDGSPTIDTTTPGVVNLVVVPQVAITQQPTDTVVSVGADATLTVAATGTAPISYQWYAYGNSAENPPTLIPSATAPALTIPNAQASDSGLYAVVVTNDYSAVTSRLATLIVGNVAPVISGPDSQTVIAGNNATFKVKVVIANPQPDFQWRTNGVDVAGATNASFTLNNVLYAQDGTAVSVVAANIAGAVTNTATLTVIVPPLITPVPASLVVNAGDPAMFISGATGVPAPALQWYKNGTAMAGRNGGTLSFFPAQGSDNGSYYLVASNAAGVATSPTVQLTVLSTTLTVTNLAPANGATGVCYDSPLTIAFDRPVSTVNAGVIRIYNLTNPATPVDTLNLSSNNVWGVQARTPFAGDSQAFNQFPVVLLSENVAAIYPHSGILTSNQTYFVTLDAGIFADSTGAYFPGFSSTSAWQFTTKPTGPANPTSLVVAADGTGDFATVQGAVDSVPLNNTTGTLIHIRDGRYVGLVNISAKHKVTFRGQSRAGTILEYANNNNLNPTTHARMTFKVNANDIIIENLTILNSTAQGGSQAEALMIESGARRCIVFNADINSRQDTILANINSSQAYFYQTTVRGNFDYIWGGGNLFFDRCTLHTLTNTLSGTYNLTAARTDFGSTAATGNWQTPDGTKWSSNGFSFVGCTLEADPGVVNISLAGANGTPGGLSSWAFCRIDSAAYTSPAGSLLTTYNFWQFENADLLGNPLSFSGIQTLTNGDPRLLAATNVTTWLNGWTPALAPEITANPVSVTVDAGSAASFSASATGIPDPTWQWLKNGSPIPGATSSALVIPVPHLADAGTYSVIVTTLGGTATSTAATLTVNPHPNTAAPVFTAPVDGSLFTINVGAGFAVTNLATDADMPAETIAFTLLSGSGTLAADGVFTWRPQVGDAGTTNVVVVKVTDDGAPNLSATNTFSVVVNPLQQPNLESSALVAGQFTLTVSGVLGPDYAVQASTNLVNWDTLFITNSPPSLFQWTDPSPASAPMRFYRLKIGPPLP